MRQHTLHSQSHELLLPQRSVGVGVGVGRRQHHRQLKRRVETTTTAATVATITAGLLITTAYDDLGAFGKNFLVDNARVISNSRVDYKKHGQEIKLSLVPSGNVQQLVESLPPLKFQKTSDLTDEEHAAMRRANAAEIEENLQDHRT